MALSMDEQRMLAEIERRLSAEDPGLAARLSSFKRPGPWPGARLRSTRGRVIGSLFTVAVVAVLSMMVYAMVPFRAHSPKTTSPQASGSPGISAAARPGPSAGSAATGDKTAGSKASTSASTAPKTSAAKAAAPKTSAAKAASGSRPSTSDRAASTAKTVTGTRTRAPALAHT